MEASPGLSHLENQLTPPEKVLANFFAAWPVDVVKEKCFYLFKAVVTHPDGQPKLPAEEVALFLDQLTDLVSAAYELHQANRVSTNPQQEDEHE